jgi:hypothetical protein
VYGYQCFVGACCLVLQGGILNKCMGTNVLKELAVSFCREEY